MPARHLVAVYAISAAVLSATPAQASLSVYSDRATFDALAPSTAIDWGVFGPAGTIVVTPDTRTVGPVTVTVTTSQSGLGRYDEGVDFTGDFAAGDHLLAQFESLSDTFVIRFDTPMVRGFGMQVEPNQLTGPWSGGIDVYDTHNNLIGTTAISGDKTGAEDDSAPFYGIVSTAADIWYASFWIDQSYDPNLPPKAGDIAINTMDVLMPPIAAPEPGGLVLLGGGLMGLAVVRLRPRLKSS